MERLKKYLQFLMLLITMLFSCCKTYAQRQKKDFRYVIAESGLNYRDKPNGNILGKFKWGQKVEYLYHTEHKQKIVDNYQELEGIWTAVKQKNDTVFVFDHPLYFSNQKPRFSRIKLYQSWPYHSNPRKEDFRQAFVNVSGKFIIPENFLHKKDLRNDTIVLSDVQRNEFLKRTNFSNNDTIFIYDLESGAIKKHLVGKTPIIASVNIYYWNRDKNKQVDYNYWDYEIGFAFGRESYYGFAMIGGENPFVEKGLRPIVFKEMNHETIEKNIAQGWITEEWGNESIDKTKIYKHYIFENEEFRFFIKSLIPYVGWNSGWKDLVVRNVRTSKSFNVPGGGGESSQNTPIFLEGQIKEHKQYQYTGHLFKNKPPVAFGFATATFGCPEIYFLDEQELPIYILCDNRH